MNYSKTEKLNQITEKILIVGIDVSKNFHVARAQDFRGIFLWQIMPSLISLQKNASKIHFTDVYIS